MFETEEIANIDTLGDIARHHAKTQPDRVAIHFEDRHISFGELDRRTNQIANGLIAEGVRPQARIAILSKNVPAFFELWFGAAKADVVLVPVNFRLAPPEVAYVIEDAGAQLLFVGVDFIPVVEKVASDLKSVRRIIALDGAHGAWPGYSDWVASQSARDPGRKVAAENCAIQMYTSGTTGHPKGAQLSHANLLRLKEVGLHEFGEWHEHDVSLVCMPLFHIGGSGWALLGIYRGVETVLLRDPDPAVILRVIPQYRVTKAFMVPALLLFILQHPQCKGTDFSSLELILYGASPAPIDLVRNAIKVFGCGLAQVYGLTETTGAITYLPPEDHDEKTAERLKSCGKPMGGVEIRVVDAAGKDVAAGEVGEIVTRSRQNMLGYWNQPEATQRALRAGWFHTGDAGYLDKDGYVYIYDRVKDMIISGGENIYPAEVESALFGHPAVADVAVIGVPDDKWGEAVKAMVVKKPGANVTAEDLIRHAGERIARYKLPRSIDFVETLPRTPTGKILKRELRKPFWTGQERQVH
ncbi:MAG TPA: fatty acid--CoA ligase [Xanthobacteraceae bacterium]|nr:fatty acid--CoA ligase [Xanthobacteraceae bacterium]